LLIHYRLIYQFQEEALVISTGSRLWEDRQVDLQTNYYNSIGWDCFSPLNTFRALKTPAERIECLWHIFLSSRSVTLASDEAICGSILMGFDLRYLLAVPENGGSEYDDVDDFVTQAEADQRMCRYWEMHTSHVPIPVLFVPGAKLPNLGFSWAPASLLSCAYSGPGKDLTGTITKSYVPDTWGGRIVRWILGSILRIPLAPAIGLSMLLPPRKAFLLSPPPASKQPAKNYLVCRLDGQKYYIRPGVDTLDFSDVSDALSQASLLAVIVEILPTNSAQSESYVFAATRAALLVVRRRGWFTWTAQYVKLVSVIRDGSDSFRHPRVPYSDADREEMSRSALEASWRIKEERWCVI
jgi:hypothetical protein